MAPTTCNIPGCEAVAITRGWCSMHYRRWQRSGDPGSAGKLRNDAARDVEPRFWKRVDKDGPGGCWLWTGPLTPYGYGNFWAEGRVMRAHRFAYELIAGPVPDDLEIDHLCRVTHCCNPAHLEAVTHAENMRRRAKAHCSRGHLMEPPNLYFGSNGQRTCRACQMERSRAYYQRKRREAKT